MKKETSTDPAPKKKETSTELKNEAVKKDTLHKGYNEKNPAQTQGAFTPDSKNTK